MDDAGLCCILTLMMLSWISSAYSILVNGIGGGLISAWSSALNQFGLIWFFMYWGLSWRTIDKNHTWWFWKFPYTLARINLNKRSLCWYNIKVIRLDVFMYCSLILTMNLHLPRGRWRTILFHTSGSTLIDQKDVILGEAHSILLDEPILDDTSRGLNLIKIHCIKVLKCSSILHRVRHKHIIVFILVSGFDTNTQW